MVWQSDLSLAKLQVKRSEFQQMERRQYFLSKVLTGILIAVFVAVDLIGWVVTYLDLAGVMTTGSNYTILRLTGIFVLQIVLTILCYMLAVYTAGSVLVQMYSRHKLVF